MMIANKKKFSGGLALMIGFVIILILFFSPIYGGIDGLDYLDNLYNSISKGSAYYIPKIKEDIKAYKGNSITVNVVMADERQAGQTALLFKTAGAMVTATDAQLKITGDLGKILENCLTDADAMYWNKGKQVSGRYNYDERAVLYHWWKAFKEMEKDLKKQKKFKEAKVLTLVMGKAIEASYNYYTIEPQKIADRLGLVIFSLIFYVVYTMWYGFAILFMFEGWGLRLEH